MALLLAMLRTLAAEDLPPVGLVTRLNRLVHDQTPGSRFITLCLAAIDPRTGACEYVNAGQTPPLLRRGGGGLRTADDRRDGAGDVRGSDLRVRPLRPWRSATCS